MLHSQSEFTSNKTTKSKARCAGASQSSNGQRLDGVLPGDFPGKGLLAADVVEHGRLCHLLGTHLRKQLLQALVRYDISVHKLACSVRPGRGCCGSARLIHAVLDRRVSSLLVVSERGDDLFGRRRHRRLLGRRLSWILVLTRKAVGAVEAGWPARRRRRCRCCSQRRCWA